MEAQTFKVDEVKVNSDGSVMLSWVSEPGAFYSLEYTPELSTDPAVWEPISGKVASHGTRTRFADIGEYWAEPEVKTPARRADSNYWRVTKVGENTGTAPVVSIDAPSANATVSGLVEIAVSATDDDEVSLITLIVDGEEVDSTTNPGIVTLNTTEWSNGPHKLVAVATDSEDTETTPSSSAETFPNTGASTEVELTFDNFVSDYSFSEDFFDPTESEVQVITAKFKALVDWTLTISDASATVVRTATGSGTTMSFSWDGKDSGGNLLPPAKYEFDLSTEEPGEGGGASEGSGASSPGNASAPRRRAKSQIAPLGTFGVAYQGHHPEPAISSFRRPPNGFPPPFNQVTLEPTYLLPYGRIRRADDVCVNFSREMGRMGYLKRFELGNDKLLGSHLRKPSLGGSSRFNTVNLGLLVGHGIRGTSIDTISSGTGAIQTYYPIYKTGATNYDWVGLSQCDFGSSELRWMAILACNILYDDQYNDMLANAVLPINDDLHLLLSASTSVYIHPDVGTYWARAMKGEFGVLNQSVKNAWYFSGTRTQSNKSNVTVTFKVAGWSDCFGDTLTAFAIPNSGDPLSIVADQQVVFTP